MGAVSPVTPLAARDVSLAEPRSLEKRGATILLFDGDGCTGGAHSIVQETGNWCYPVPQPKRSLHGVGNCAITTWSGTDCRGSSANFNTLQCYNVLYGSV